MSEEQNGQDLASRTYPPPEDFAKNANIQDPEVWSKAYFDLKKSVDPLLWEMTLRDKFAGFWGEKPRG